MTEDYGYEFPVPVDPGDLYCFRVYVPKHLLYLSAFWNAYRFFGRWVAWMRDPLKQGIKAAQVWQRAIDKAQAEFDLTEGECMASINGIEQDALDPCKVTFTFDDGTSFVLDLGLCASCGGGSGSACLPQMRVSGGQIQRYDPGTGTWVPAGPQPDPIIDGPQTTIDPAKNQSRCDAAWNAAQNLHNTKNKAIEILNVTTDVMLFGGDLLIFLVPFEPELALAFGVVEICSLVIEAIMPSIDTAGPIDVRDEAACIIFKHMGADGTFSKDQWQAVYNEFGQKASDVGAGPERAVWNCFSLTTQLIGATGLNSMAINGTSNGADCSACEWQAVINFAGDPGPFKLQPFSNQGANFTSAGKYNKPLGWETSPSLPASIQRRDLFTAVHFQMTHFTYAKIEGLTDLTGYHGVLEAYGCQFILVGNDEPGLGHYAGSTVLGHGTVSPFSFETAGPFDTGVLGLFATWQHDGGDPGYGAMVFTKLTLRGTGPIPPELAPYVG